MSFHRPPELPTELWTQILTYLSNDEIVRLKGLSRAFWHAALDISYGTLTLTPFKEVPKFPLPARLIWLFRLRKKARRFKQPHVAERVRTVHVVPNMEYTVWTLPGLFDHVQPKTTCQCLFLMFLFLCLWPIRWVIKHAVFIKPTFWLSLASSYELASTLAHLHSVQTLHLEEIIYSFICCGGIELYYHLKKPIPSFRSSLICCTLDTFAPTLLHLKLTIRSKGFDGFPCHFPALRSLEIVLYFRNASSFLPQIRSSLQSSVFLERFSLQTRRIKDPLIVDHPLPSHIHFSFLRVLKFDIEPHYIVQDCQSAQNVSEIISQYRRQLEELEIRFRGSIWSQTSLNDPQRHVFSDSFCALPTLDALRRLSINFLDVRPWESVGGGWFDKFMANLDRSPLNSLTHLSIEIAQIIYPHSHLALLPSLECFRLKASDLSVKLLASIPTRMPNLKRFQMLCQGKIVSASSLDLFIETNKLDQLPILSEELGQWMDRNAYMNTGESHIEIAEIWLAPETHVAFSGLYRNRRPPKPTHMDDLVRVFVDRIPSLLPQTKLYPLRPQ